MDKKDKKQITKQWLIAGGILAAVALGGWLWWSKQRGPKAGMKPGQFGPGQEMTDEQREGMKEDMVERMKDEGLTEEEIELRLEQGPRGMPNGDRPARPMDQ